MSIDYVHTHHPVEKKMPSIKRLEDKPIECRAGGSDPSAPPSISVTKGYEEKKIKTPVENYRPVRRPVETQPKSIRKPDVPLSLRAGNIDHPQQ